MGAMKCALPLLLLAACATTEHLAAEGALGPYSGSVRAGGFVFCSGKIGTRGDAFRTEFETALDAVERELARSGLDLSHVVQANVFLTDLGLYKELNGIYASRFSKPYPARTTVGVHALPGNARVEIAVIARR